MNDKVKAINVGFGNCTFVTRDPKMIRETIFNKVTDTKIVLLSNIPCDVKVETIDDFHDKLSLVYEDKDENVEGVITWKMASNGKHYLFEKFEKNA